MRRISPILVLLAILLALPACGAGGAPSTMDLIHQAGVTGVFVNTGRHVLYLADFLFDAGGRVGYRPLAPPLR